MSDTHLFDDNAPPLTTERLTETTKAIRKLYFEGKTIHDIRQQYPSFCVKYPKLVDKLMEPNMSQQQLDYIVKMFDNVQHQRTTLDKASKKIGNEMFEQYVAPNLSNEQLARVKKKMSALNSASPEELAEATSRLAQQQMGQFTNPSHTPQSSTTNASSQPTHQRRKKKLKKPPKDFTV